MRDFQNYIARMYGEPQPMPDGTLSGDPGDPSVWIQNNPWLSGSLPDYRPRNLSPSAPFRRVEPVRDPNDWMENNPYPQQGGISSTPGIRGYPGPISDPGDLSEWIMNNPQFFGPIVRNPDR